MSLDINCSSKGQGTVLLVSIGVLAAFLAGIVAFTQASVLPDVFEQRTNDLSTLSKTETKAENIEELYTPLAAKYSLHQATYNITEMREHCVSATNCGGENFVNAPVDADFPNCLFDMFGEDGNFRGNKSNGDSSEFKYHYNFYMECVDEVAKGYYDQYSDTLDYGGCEVNVRDNNVTWNKETGNLEVESSGGAGLVSAECTDTENTMNYTSNDDFLERKITKNNYDSMMLALYKITREMENVTEEIERNDNYYGVKSSSKSCTANNTDLVDQAISDARSDGLDKIDQVRVAIVEQGHGIGSGSQRGGNYIFDEITGETDIPILNYIVDYLVRNIDADIANVASGWYDGGNYKTEVESTSSSTCACRESSCSGSELSYTGSDQGSCSQSGSCEYDYSNPAAECPPGDYKSGGTCYNSSSSPRHVTGSPSCDAKDGYSFTHDGSGGCDLANPDNYLGCDQHCWEADADVRWWVSWMEVYMNVTDDEDGKIPTSEGWIQLEWNEKYDRPIEDAPWE